MASELRGFDFSIATNAQGGLAAKRVTRRADGSLAKQGYDGCTFWRFERQAVATMEGMAAVLGQLLHEPSKMIVLGELLAGCNPKGAWRRRWASPDPAQNVLHCPARWWLPIDADKVHMPEGLGSAARWREGAVWLRDHRLPACFSGKRCIIVPSASTGLLDDELSVRLFFLLDAPVEVKDLAAWALAAQKAGFAIDPVVVRTGQPIYTARPIFEGMRDPLVLASNMPLAFVADGDGDRVSINLDEFDAQAAAFDAAMQRTRPAGAGGTWSETLAATLGGAESFNVPLMRAARHAAALDVPADEFVAAAGALVQQRIEEARAAAVTRAERLPDAERARAMRAAKDAAQMRLAQYSPRELRRFHRNCSRYETAERARLHETLAFLGLKQKGA